MSEVAPSPAPGGSPARGPRAAIAIAAWAITVAGAWVVGARHAAQALARPDDVPRHIEIPRELVEALAADHARRIGREPTDDERRTLVDAHVDREVLYREALALELGDGDLIVRRRLVQKMEALVDTFADVAEPTDDELRAYVATHADRYREPARTTFVHVFVGRDAHGDALERTAWSLRERLRDGENPEQLGDPFIRGRRFVGRTHAQIDGMFGAGFAAAVDEATAGAWSPPVPSSFGLHLVRVEKRQPARDPSFDEVAGRALRELTESRRAEARRAALADLRARYTIEVAGEPPGGPAG